MDQTRIQRGTGQLIEGKLVVAAAVSSRTAVMVTRREARGTIGADWETHQRQLGENGSVEIRSITAEAATETRDESIVDFLFVG